MKQKYIAYYSYTKLDHTIVRAYSPAEAKYIVEKRLKKNGLFEPIVDKVMTEAEEMVMAVNDEW